jgi:hypothetical protein
VNFRLKISGRLYAGFTALVVVGLVMAVVAVWNLWTMHGEVARLSAISDNSSRVQEISVNLQAMRRANLRYVYDANDAAFTEAAERETTTIALLRAAAETTRSDERLRIYNGLAADIEKLRSLRERLGAAVNEASHGKSTLLAGGDELTASVGKLLAAARNSSNADVAAFDR